MQRIFLWLCLGTFLVLAGCTFEGDKIYNTYNYPGDSSGMMQIASPAPGAMLEALYNWVPSPYHGEGCPWGYEMDTSIVARVICHVPGQVRDAQVYSYQNGYGHFSPYGDIIHPSSDTFDIPIYTSHTGFDDNFNPDTLEKSVWVQVTTTDSSNYSSRTLSFSVACRLADQPHTAPAAPIMDTVNYTSYNNELVTRWCAASPLVTRYVTHYLPAFTGVVGVDTLYSPYCGAGVSVRYPTSDYSVWVKAVNDYGISTESDTLHIHIPEPEVPTFYLVTPHPGGVVELRWEEDVHGFDSVFVERRDSSSSFAVIAALGRIGSCYIPYYYIDSTAEQHSVNFYRIGTYYATGTWWMPDSTGIWVP